MSATVPERYRLPHGFVMPSNLHRNAGLSSFLYFMKCGELVKVGISDNVEQRIHAARLTNPFIGEVSFVLIPKCLARQVERKVHEALAAKARGREWFAVTRREARNVAGPIVRQAWEAENSITTQQNAPRS